MPTYTLNFSCNSAFVLAQLGREGYTSIMNNCVENARYLAEKLKGTGKFEMINEAQMLPIVAVKLTDQIQNYTVYDLSSKLRERGWVIAAYTMPENAQEVALMRIVVREHFSRDMADILHQDIENACKTLETCRTPQKALSKEKHRPIF